MHKIYNKNKFFEESRPHESGKKHVTGLANYTDDILEPDGILYAFRIFLF